MFKKVLYLGWLGNANVGHELEFEVFKKLMAKESDRQNLTIIVDKYIPMQNYEIDVTQYDLVVLGGGSIFSSILEEICLKANSCNIPITVWGTGLDNRDKNKVKTIIKAYENNEKYLCNPRTRIVVNLAALAGVRGNIEKHLLNDKKVDVLGDPSIIFNWLNNKYPETKSVNDFINGDENIMLINWGTSYNNIIGKNEENIQRNLEKTAKELLDRGYKVIVYPTWNLDINPCKSFVNNLNNPNVYLIEKVYDAYSLAGIIQKCKFSINFKMSANLLSMSMKKPFISLAYGLKCYDFAESIDSKDLILLTDDIDAEKLLEKVKYIEENYNEIQRRFANFINLYSKNQTEFMGKIVSFFKEKDTSSPQISPSRGYIISSSKKKQVFTTLFPPVENCHLVKDVGMIPYMMQRYFGYDAKIAGYATGEFPYLDKGFKGLKIDRMNDTGNLKNDVLNYLLENAKNIDILHVFHPEYTTLEWIEMYKTLNPNGKVYLKLDANASVKGWIYSSVFNEKQRDIFHMCDLISVETIDLYKYLNEQWPIKVEYIPNGFFAEDYKNTLNIRYEEKENVICTVGRIGNYAKATEILTEAFARVCDELDGWTLKFIGPIEEHFKGYIQRYFLQHPQLEGRVVFTGEISDREALSREYRKAKIFCLPSRWESFGIVLAEAIQHGCYIIGANFLSINDITDNKKYGDVFEIDNVEQLSECLIKACSDEQRLKRVCKEVQSHAYKRFNWGRICSKVDRLLKQS
ncbi:glycosyltransferase [Wukongibacter baidiensis]|uniref:glycosyltransferase n=1 Tax=Wukongibacter baidiensis TaxID=1723361 RepID=UPI003D7FDEE4